MVDSANYMFCGSKYCKSMGRNEASLLKAGDVIKCFLVRAVIDLRGDSDNGYAAMVL
jgi:hypothetical protein